MLDRGITAVLETDGARLKFREVMGSRAQEVAGLWAWAAGCVLRLKLLSPMRT